MYTGREKYSTVQKNTNAKKEMDRKEVDRRDVETQWIQEMKEENYEQDTK